MRNASNSPGMQNDDSVRESARALNVDLPLMFWRCEFLALAMSATTLARLGALAPAVAMDG
jgi:hypothetical protein